MLRADSEYCKIVGLPTLVYSLRMQDRKTLTYTAQYRKKCIKLYKIWFWIRGISPQRSYSWNLFYEVKSFNILNLQPVSSVFLHWIYNCIVYSKMRVLYNYRFFKATYGLADPHFTGWQMVIYTYMGINWEKHYFPSILVINQIIAAGNQLLNGMQTENLLWRCWPVSITLTQQLSSKENRLTHAPQIDYGLHW